MKWPSRAAMRPGDRAPRLREPVPRPSSAVDQAARLGVGHAHGPRGPSPLARRRARARRGPRTSATQEQPRSDEHDRRAAGDVEPVGQYRPEHGARDADQRGDRHQAGEADDQHLGRRRRRDQHRDHEDDPDGLEADDDRQGNQREEQVLEPLHRDARRGGAERVERRVQQLLPQQRDDDDHARPEDRSATRSCGADREHVAEQEAEQVADVALDRAEHEHAQRERPGEQHPDRRVLADPPPAS